MRGKARPINWLILIIFLIGCQLYVSRAYAATVTSASDTLSTIQQSVLADHTIQFITSTGVGAGKTITITFPTGFALGTFSVTNENMSEGNSSCASFAHKTLAASASGATWGVGQSGQVITFTSGTDTVTAGDCVQILIGANATFGGSGTSIITNQTAAQNATNPNILIGGTMTDSGTIAVAIIVNNTVAVTGTVSPAITCSINSNASAFGTFTAGTVTTAGTTPIWTISTNAANGYSLSVKSAGNGTNAGLYSATANYVLKSSDSAQDSTADLSVATTIGYGLQGSGTNGDTGSASTTIASPYTSSGTTVGRLQLTSQTLASATGPVSNATITSTYKAKVTDLVPPGSYTDTLTYVCTGTF